MVDFIVGEKGVQEVPTVAGKPEETQKPEVISADWIPLLIFAIAALLFLYLFIRSIDEKYVDFGDGNYLYISWRLTQGETLYHQIPCPQPPLLLFWGAFLLSLQSGDPIFVRLWQAVQHVLIGCCVFGIVRRVFTRPDLACLAGMIYLFLPEGVWWASGYQSEPLLILVQCFNLLMFVSAIQREQASPALYGAAFTAALTCFINMTSLPYVALQWFFVGLRYRGFLWRYTLALCVPILLGLLGMNLYTNGVYLEQIFFRQVGTYPHHSWLETITYFVGKLNSEGGDILFYEGGFVMAAMMGILLFANDERKFPAKEYLIWWGIFSLGSIIFVTKGGTVEYIFTLGEPATAVFSAFFFSMILLATDVSLRPREILNGVIPFGKFTLLLCLVLPALLMKPFTLLYQSFTNSNQAYELPGETMRGLAQMLQRLCPPNKSMLAPPYYAYLAKRRITDNASELFVLAHAYFNEWSALKRERRLPFDLPELDNPELNKFLQANMVYGQVQRWASEMADPDFNQSIRIADWRLPYDRRERSFYDTRAVFALADLFEKEPALREKYAAIALFLDLRKQIQQKETALLLVNTRHPFFAVPPLHQAIRDYCFPLENPPLLPNREERIMFYLVKS